MKRQIISKNPNPKRNKQEDKINRINQDPTFLPLIFSKCETISSFQACRCTCKLWQNIISDQHNQSTILYKLVQAESIEKHREAGNFRLARNICEQAIQEGKEIEHFTNINQNLIAYILSSTQLIKNFLSSIQGTHGICIPLIRDILFDPLLIINANFFQTLQDHIELIISNMLKFINKNQQYLDQAASLIIAHILKTLIQKFDQTGKLNVILAFLNCLEKENTIFKQVIHQEFTFFLEIMNSLCNDTDIDIQGQSTLTAGLMAIQFPDYQYDAWILFLSSFKKNADITNGIIQTIEKKSKKTNHNSTNDSTDSNEIDITYNFPFYITNNIFKNDKLFLECLTENQEQFIYFLKQITTSDDITIKSFATIALLAIYFNRNLFPIKDREYITYNYNQTFKENQKLFDTILNLLNKHFNQTVTTQFLSALNTAFNINNTSESP